MSSPDVVALSREVVALAKRVVKLEAALAERPRMARVVSISPLLEVQIEGDTGIIPAAFKADGSTPAVGDIVKVETVGERVFVTPFVST